MTRNDKDLDIANGDRFKVTSVSKDTITLCNGKREIHLNPKKTMHLDYAYATTVHSSQGLTANRVLIDANVKSRTTLKDVFYVAISRARFFVKIYTNDRSSLPEAISRRNIKYAAYDLAQEKCS